MDKKGNNNDYNHKLISNIQLINYKTKIITARDRLINAYFALIQHALSRRFVS